jgi:PAS domain S-box-containing protein
VASRKQPDPYDGLSREELVARLRALEQAGGAEQKFASAVHELEVAQEELRVQNETLRGAQAELVGTRDRYSDLYDFAPVGYLTLNVDGMIQGANLTAASLLGVERGRLLGTPLLGRIIREDRLVWLEHLRRCRNGESDVTSEMRLETPVGRVIPCQLTSRTSCDAEGPHLRTVLTDLTESKWAAEQIRRFNAELEQRVAERTAELEKAVQALQESEVRERARAAELEAATADLREADRRKDEFLAMLGHELRNPLGPIRSAIEMLRIEGLSEAERIEMREVIERQVIHMARITDDLLDVSRISRGKILLRRETLDLAKLARETAHDFVGEYTHAGLTLEVDVTTEPLWCHGDETRLAQVIGNLLHNSVKFTERGGKVTLRARREAADGTALVEVIDTGIGMEPEVVARVFETFSQADRSLDRSRGGLGLGLALVKGLVELHGGTVECHSEGLGKGTRLTIGMPLAAAPKGGRPAAAKGEAARRLRILVVDDRRDAVHTLAALLRRIGHEVVTAGDGEAGLKAAREFRPDVVLSDIGLPKMDGYQLARAIRRDRDLAGTYLIAASGYGQLEDQHRATEAGFNDFLTKPVGLADLRQALSSVPTAV